MCQLKLKMFSGIVVTLFISISGVTSKTTDQNYEVDELIVHLTSFINEEWVNMNSSQVDVDRNSYLFSYILIDKYGTSGVITESQLNSFITDVRDNWHVSDLKDHSEGPDSHVSQDSCSTGFEESLKCLDNKCLFGHDILKLHNVTGPVNISQLLRILPTVTFSLLQSGCSVTSGDNERAKPPAAQVWGFGFLCVTLINLCALLGLIFIPLMKRSFYKNLLMFMVALGVGTLTGSSIIFLIPECFGLPHENSPFKDDFVWKSTVVIGGIYLFFLTERILQGIMDYKKIDVYIEDIKEDEEHHMHRDNVSSVKLKTRTRNDSASMNMNFNLPDSLDEKEMPLHTDESTASNLSQKHLVSQNEENEEGTMSGLTEKYTDRRPNAKQNGDIEGLQTSRKEQQIRSVAWMVIFGDGLHNFIDGLSIGAAFSENIMAGVSVSLAVICEELPHELGDFAILLNSGMSVKQALAYNFLSACSCYLGLVIGILIGELTSGSPWIFALAGGMFLYISLVDMLPELNHEAQEQVKNNGRPVLVFLIQNVGLLLGYGLMLFLAIYTAKIDLSG